MLILMPNYWMPDSFTDNVVTTLRRMGHGVITPGWRKTGLHSLRLRYERMRLKASASFVTERERWLLQQAREHKPDLVLSLTTAVNEDVLRQLKRFGVRFRVAWWGDAPANMPYGKGLLTPEWDLICLKDPDAVRKFRCLGLNAVLLHEAMNPEWHTPIASQANNAVVVAGNYYGYRQALAQALMARGVELTLYGPPMPLWAAPELKQRHTGKYIVKRDKALAFGEALACLNSTHLSEGNSLNCRAFEIAGCGGLQLIESRPIVQECFEPGAEVLMYETLDDIMEHLDRARHDTAGARRVREAGARRALAEHTYRHRLDRLFSLLSAC